jgi:glycosyltransferase involved in cell wall biosynthesis
MSNPDSDLLTVIVPAYNEEATIETTIRFAQDVARELPIKVEFVMINDGSTDRTLELMRSLAREFPNMHLVDNGMNIGLGRSVLKAINTLPDHSWACIIPGDNEFFFDSITNHLAIRKDYDVILGYCQNLIVRSLSRRLASAAYAEVVNWVYGYSYRYHNGMKMFRASAFKGIEVEARGYAYFAELLAKAILRDPALRVGEAPFVARGRAKGVSKAFRPRAIALAALEVYRGSKSVDRYRVVTVRENSTRARIR